MTNDSRPLSPHFSVFKIIFLLSFIFVIGFLSVVIVFGDINSILLSRLDSTRISQSPLLRKVLDIPEEYPFQVRVISHFPEYRIDPGSINYPLLMSYLKKLDLLPLQDRSFFNVGPSGKTNIKKISPQLIVVDLYPSSQAEIDLEVDKTMRTRGLYVAKDSKEKFFQYYRGQLSADETQMHIPVYVGEIMLATETRDSVERIFNKTSLLAILFSIQYGPLDRPSLLEKQFDNEFGYMFELFVKLEPHQQSLLSSLKEISSEWKLVKPVYAEAGCLGGAECGKEESVWSDFKYCQGGVYSGDVCISDGDCDGSVCAKIQTGTACVYDYFTNCNYFGSGNCGETCGACVFSSSCTYDAGLFCGDGTCSPSIGELCDECVDCGSCTGLWCGDGDCNNGETCNSCSQDCGSCVSCPDGDCNNGENCSSCPNDCGACAAVTADVRANGSNGPITVAAPYNVSWTSTNATACLLDGVSRAVNNVTGITKSNSPGPYTHLLECSGLGSPATDTVSVTVDCNILTADVKANGSDADITTYNDYTISWSSANADSCTLNGSGVGLSGSQVEPATVNGDYAYTLACSTSICSRSDTVNVEVNFCGNGSCNAFENCASCTADCGACPTPWWQLAGGHLYSNEASGVAIASQIADDPLFCIEPSCIAALSIRDRADTIYSDGFPFTAGGSIDTNGQMITYRDPDVFVIDTAVTRLIENYTYFYARYSLGSSPTDYFAASANDALKPTFVDQDSYFHSGDLTIQSPWAVASGESYVIFVDGSLNIQDPAAEGELITVEEGGFLAFIVSGDINIDETVGHSVLTNTAGNLEGIFIADGVITIGSNGTADKRFVGEGTFAGHGGVSLDRTYDELTNNNDRYPAETFVYRPDFIKNTPDQMKRSQMLWQETN